MNISDMGIAEVPDLPPRLDLTLKEVEGLAAERDTLSLETIKGYLDRLKREGDVFLTPTNWRTSQGDLEIAWQAMRRETSFFAASYEVADQ